MTSLSEQSFLDDKLLKVRSRAGYKSDSGIHFLSVEDNFFAVITFLHGVARLNLYILFAVHFHQVYGWGKLTSRLV